MRRGPGWITISPELHKVSQTWNVIVVGRLIVDIYLLVFKVTNFGNMPWHVITMLTVLISNIMLQTSGTSFFSDTSYRVGQYTLSNISSPIKMSTACTFSVCSIFYYCIFKMAHQKIHWFFMGQIFANYGHLVYKKQQRYRYKTEQPTCCYIQTI